MHKTVYYAIFVGMLAGVVLTASVASATTQSTGVGGGTLSWTVTTNGGNCGYHGEQTFTQWNFGPFTFVLSGKTYPLGGSAAYFNSPGGISCPPQGGQPPAGTDLNGPGFTIHFTPQAGGYGSATYAVVGYINPKYVIWGVTYAPPGPISYVNYTNSNVESTTNTISSSFSSTFAVSLETKIGISIKGWKAGTSNTASSSHTQTNTSSNTIQITKSAARGDTTYGPSDPYVGINHDYDIVWVWLNPVELFTIYKNGSGGASKVQWNGYGYSEMDQPAIDLYPVYIGWLNGDIPMTPAQAAPLKRAWAIGQVWPSGQGPGLTGPGPGTDFENIAKIDPYWECTPRPANCPTSVDPVRYTLTTNIDFIYLQAPVGGQPINQTYTENYVVSNTVSQGASYTASQTYATETTFGFSSDFWLSFSSTLKTANTYTHTNTWDKSLNTTNSSSALLSITGPPCVVSGNACNPVYTKSTQFDLYEDSLFGTFYLNPVN